MFSKALITIGLVCVVLTMFDAKVQKNYLGGGTITTKMGPFKQKIRISRDGMVLSYSSGLRNRYK